MVYEELDVQPSNDYKGGAAAVISIFFFKHKRPQMSVKVRYAGRILGRVESADPAMTLPGDDPARR